MSVKDQRRLDRVTGLECKDGRLFIDAATAALTDLSGVRLLRCGVDTVRQLYKGLIRPEIMELFDNPGTLVDFAGQRFHMLAYCRMRHVELNRSAGKAEMSGRCFKK